MFAGRLPGILGSVIEDQRTGGTSVEGMTSRGCDEEDLPNLA